MPGRRSAPMPTKTLNSTTAGTTLLASELNGIRRDVEVDEVERLAFLEQRRAEERRGLSGGNISGKSKTAASATAHSSTSTAPTRRPEGRASSSRSAPSPPMSETVTYGSTVICSSLT